LIFDLFEHSMDFEKA